MAYVPGQRATYKQPRKITLGKVLVLGGLAAAVYFGIVFIPPYYGYYRASSILKDESSKAYSAANTRTWSRVPHAASGAGITHVESTADHYTAKTGTWGDWVVWEDGRSGVTDIYGLQLGTGLEVRLTDNGAWNQAPTLRGDVMCFRTTLWGGAAGWDLAVMDLSSGAVRRVTEQSSPTLWKCAFVDSGWLVYQHQTFAGDPQRYKIFAKHLVKLGILDAGGHVIAP